MLTCKSRAQYSTNIIESCGRVEISPIVSRTMSTLSIFESKVAKVIKFHLLKKSVRVRLAVIWIKAIDVVTSGAKLLINNHTPFFMSPFQYIPVRWYFLSFMDLSGLTSGLCILTGHASNTNYWGPCTPN